MIVEQQYRIKLSEIGRDNKVTNKSLLGYLEDVGGIHSNKAGYGVLDIPHTHLTWLLLDWKLKVIRRPNYSETITAKTWSKDSLKCYAFRDFEVCDENNNIIALATSKWILINTEKGKIERVSPEMLEKYEPELNKTVFDNEEFEKIKEPEEFECETLYKVKRADIDVNDHVHNLNYLELANEALPEEAYRNQYDNVRINYKKEIKLGETVLCKYSHIDNKHIVTVKSEDDQLLHAIIELW